MKQTEDGGPAFPSDSACPSWQCRKPSAGMTLRDWFAGQALAGCLSSQTPESHWAFAQFPQDEHNDTKSLTGIARLCYDLADAMLAARKGNQ